MGAPSKLGFKLEQTFFGFKPEHQVQFHDQLYELLLAGEGCWDWDTIYHLPLHIRKFWITKINKKRTEAAEQAEKLKQSSNTASRIKKTKL
jgi:hypothetical protein